MILMPLRTQALYHRDDHRPSILRLLAGVLCANQRAIGRTLTRRPLIAAD